MSGHESRINDALKHLGEEFRLGMVQAEEYRARRRLLLDSWGERDATTSPGSLRARAVTTATTRNVAASAAAPAPRRGGIVVVVVALVIMIGAAAFLFSRGQKPVAAPTADGPAVPAQSAQVLAARKAADVFLAANSWESSAINTFLLEWRALSAAERAQASQQPSLRTLRYQLTQNIEAESQLVGPDATPEQRQRLSTLEDFARDLGPEGS